MNFDRLRFVADRAELGEGREAMLSVEIPEGPGSFYTLHSIIHPRAVTEFIYRYDDPMKALVFLSFHLNTHDRKTELEEVLTQLEKADFPAVNISDNELAKTHARFMIGGRQVVRDERVFRFEFPERPSSLRTFLTGLQSDWNLSLFHYRYHGGDVAQILAGIQVPPQDTDEFDSFLINLGYPYVEETDNIVYKQFLRQ